MTPRDRQAFGMLEFRPPAAQGDVLRAIAGEPTAIGLIDGYFGDRLAVHQKELLEAMQAGIPVYGAASMGALRAAELSPYGMVGIGSVFQSFERGEATADADVAVTHGPAELGFVATSISMVDVRETLAALGRRRVFRPVMLKRILRAADSLYFPQRTWQRVSSEAIPNGSASSCLLGILEKSHVQQKRIDAIQLARLLATGPLEAPCNVPALPMTRDYLVIRDRALSRNS